MNVIENVELWNAFAGSSQILTNGVKTIPEYTDATHPEDENGGLVVELRAERSGDKTSGRVYHLTVMAEDLAGNAVTGKATCVVPHDRGEGK